MTDKISSSPLQRCGFHLLLSGKGGVGKSVVARLLAEFLADKGDPPMAFDADPVNASFAAVPAFKAKVADLIDDDQKINASRFDAMIEDVLEAERPVVIDSGASSYLPLIAYMEENDLVTDLKSEGFDVYLHSIITGGAAADFTTHNFNDVASRFGDEAKVVVWLNHFWGKVVRDGKPFTEWRTYRANRDRIHCVFEIPKMASDTSAADFASMLERNVSLAEASGPQSDFRVMQRSRLFKIRRAIFEAMQTIHAQRETATQVEEAAQ